MEKWPVWIRLKPKIWSERAFFVQKSANHLQGGAFLPSICSSLPEKMKGMTTKCRGKDKDLFSGISAHSAHEPGEDKEDKHAGEEQRDRGEGKDR